MLKTVTCQHQGDTYEALYDTEGYSFQVVWRYRANGLRPSPNKFEELPRAVQDKLENEAIQRQNLH